LIQDERRTSNIDSKIHLLAAYVGSWHLCDMAGALIDVRFRGQCGHAANIAE
jgi:hypothetical protein